MVEYCLFFNDAATTEIYTLSLHDALPISDSSVRTRIRLHSSQRTTASGGCLAIPARSPLLSSRLHPPHRRARSEEHTSELQSRQYLVCRLLLEKKSPHSTNCCVPPAYTLY